MGCNPPGSSIHGLFQARMLEWLPLPSPGDLPYPGIEPRSLASPALTGKLFHQGTTWRPDPSLSGGKLNIQLLN